MITNVRAEGYHRGWFPVVGSKTTTPGESGHDLSARGFVYHRVFFSFDAIVYHRQGLGSHKGQVRTVQYPTRGKKPPQMIIDLLAQRVVTVGYFLWCVGIQQTPVVTGVLFSEFGLVAYRRVVSFGVVVLHLRQGLVVHKRER